MVSSGRFAVLAQMDRIALADQPAGWVEFGVPQLGMDTSHGIVVNKVVQHKPVMPVCATLSGASLKVRAPADGRNASSAGKGEGLCEQQEQDGGGQWKVAGACDVKTVKSVMKTK